jgi:hypothetical protein
MVRMHWRVGFALVVAVGALLSRSAFTPVAFTQSGSWTVIPSPNQGTRDNELLGIAAVSANDIWSVGSVNVGPYAESLRTLTEFWNGTSWSIIPSSNPATTTGDYDALQGVAALSASNVWAVGYSGCVSCSGDHSLIEHWNGSNWSIVSNPTLYPSQDLYGIAAVSANDIWAVGKYGFTPYGALIEHWNGTQWSAVTNPGTQALHGVTALASNNVWAVGDSEILHWNGTSWSIVPDPQSTSSSGDYLRAVAAVSASDIWAVGYAEVASGEGYTYRPVIEHGDGSSWTVSYSAFPPFPNNDTLTLGGVTALAGTSVWAVGGYAGSSFVEQWNGSQWTVVSHPDVSSSANRFEAATALAATGDVWAVGEYYSATTSSYQTLIEESPNNPVPPAAPSTPSPTPTPLVTPMPTATPTPVPTCGHRNCH